MSFRLHLKNFQSIREETLDISPLTFLCGPNASGKSSVADALSILSGALGREARGAASSDMWKYRLDQAQITSLGIGCDFTADDFGEDYFLELENSLLEGKEKPLLLRVSDMVGVSRHLKSGDFIFNYFNEEFPDLVVYINGVLCIECWQNKGFIDFFIDHPDVVGFFSGIDFKNIVSSAGALTLVPEGEKYRLHAQVEVVDGWPAVRVHDYSFTDPSHCAVQHLINLLLGLVASVSGAFFFRGKGVHEIAHVGPLRMLPGGELWAWREWLERGIAPSGVPVTWHDGSAAWFLLAKAVAERTRQSLVDLATTSLGSDGDEDLRKIYVDSYDQKLLSDVNRFLSAECLGMGYQIDGGVEAKIDLSSTRLPPTLTDVLNSEWRVGLKVRDDQGRAHELKDVGVGVSQVVPVLVAGISRQFSIIEQPELHLHPKLHLELASFFIEMVSADRMFVIETHSENIFLRVLRAIRETSSSDIPHRRFNLRPDQVSVLFFEKIDGETRIKRLRISEDGEFIDRWPGGFFAEREAELF